MRDYDSGNWGFMSMWGIEGSVFPRAAALAFPNAALTFLLSTCSPTEMRDEESTDTMIAQLTGFTSVLFFVLYFRSNIAYERWWEGGTLLQKTRGEWFNAFSSLMAFTTLNRGMDDQVEEFSHLICRLMSLLFCCALQQVSPRKDRPLEILDLKGIDPESLEFLNDATDKVEVILQWIQRTAIINMSSGVLSAPPPVLSRAFQEVSRGIVNLQNARKIADFPFPFPYAQVSMVMLLVHWAYTPIACSMLFGSRPHQHVLAACTSFLVIFCVWCINFIALQLESPFGDKDNDLPMEQFQRDWNKSLIVLMTKRGHTPPSFKFDPEEHRQLFVVVSDGSTPRPRRGRRPSDVKATKARISVISRGSDSLSDVSDVKATMARISVKSHNADLGGSTCTSPDSPAPFAESPVHTQAPESDEACLGHSEDSLESRVAGDVVTPPPYDVALVSAPGSSPATTNSREDKFETALHISIPSALPPGFGEHPDRHGCRLARSQVPPSQVNSMDTGAQPPESIPIKTSELLKTAGRHLRRILQGSNRTNR